MTDVYIVPGFSGGGVYTPSGSGRVALAAFPGVISDGPVSPSPPPAFAAGASQKSISDYTNDEPRRMRFGTFSSAAAPTFETLLMANRRRAATAYDDRGQKPRSLRHRRYSNPVVVSDDDEMQITLLW